MVAKPSAFGGAFHDSGDIDEGDDGRQDLLGSEDLGQFGKTGVRHADDADIGFDRGKGIVGRKDVVLGQSVKKGGLAHIGHSNDSDREAHEE